MQKISSTITSSMRLVAVMMVLTIARKPVDNDASVNLKVQKQDGPESEQEKRRKRNGTRLIRTGENAEQFEETQGPQGLEGCQVGAHSNQGTHELDDPAKFRTKTLCKVLTYFPCTVF